MTIESLASVPLVLLSLVALLLIVMIAAVVWVIRRGPQRAAERRAGVLPHDASPSGGAPTTRRALREQQGRKNRRSTWKGMEDGEPEPPRVRPRSKRGRQR